MNQLFLQHIFDSSELDIVRPSLKMFDRTKMHMVKLTCRTVRLTDTLLR
jgi:hypothetical protein